MKENRLMKNMAALILGSTFVALFALGSVLSAEPPSVNETEPNDKREQAQNIPIPCIISGTFNHQSKPDHYLFVVGNEGLPSLHAVLSVKGTVNPYIQLLDGAGTKLTESDFFRESYGENLTSLLLPPGSYFLCVNVRSWAQQEGVPYQLRITQVPEVTVEEIRTALNKALDYLIAQQEDNGGFVVRMGKVAMPAMAIQAWLGAGCLNRDDWKAVYRAIDFVREYYHDPASSGKNPAQQKKAGGIFAHKDLYEHAIALTALIEAYAMGVEEDLPEVIRNGLDFLLRAQCCEERPAALNGPITHDSIYHGGWRYAVNSTDADISVTGWQIITLTAAKAAGFQVPPQRLTWALDFVRRCFNNHSKEFAYRPAGRTGTGRSAMGALSMQLLGAGDTEEVAHALRTIMYRAPAWEGEPGGTYPFYYWYYGTRAAYLAGGQTWDLWHQAMCGLLVRHQNKDGSWELNHDEERKLDKVYGAALGALILELCCGSPPIYLRTEKAPPRSQAPLRDEITVSIDYPTARSMVQGSMEIKAIPEVPDRIRVRRVTFLLDGEELGTATAAPWAWETDLGPGVRSRRIQVVAENDLGTQAEATVVTKEGQNRVQIRIVKPRGRAVLGTSKIKVSASGHPDSPLREVTIHVDGQEAFRGAELPFEMDFDFGAIGGQKIVAATVNALGKEAADSLVLPEAPALEVDFVATVTDAHNNYVLDLEKEGFLVRENGITQEILRFSRELTPVSMAIVLDTSGSIRRHMKAVQEAAVRFVSQIRPTDRVLVVDFSDHAKVVQTFTSDISRLQKVIRGTKAKGGTALYDAVITACTQLKREKGRTAIILLTDGKDEDKRGTGPGSRHTFEQAMDTAKESGVTVYALGLGKNIARAVLEDLARQSGGRAYFPPTVKDLAEVYGLVAKELRSQYTIGYSSTNRIRNGEWRTLEVTTPHRTLTVRTKEGYFAR